jgi:hypothetical protein
MVGLSFQFLLLVLSIPRSRIPFDSVSHIQLCGLFYDWSFELGFMVRLLGLPFTVAAIFMRMNEIDLPPHDLNYPLHGHRLSFWVLQYI